MTELKRINFETGKFESNGKKYYIAPLEMGYNRLVPFSQRQSEVMHGVKIEDAIKFIYNVYTEMKKGEEGNYKQSFLNAFEELSEFCKNLEGYNPEKIAQQSYEKYYEYCTYFILREDEDINSFDPRIAEQKIEDWKTDIYPKDFFFAVFYRLNLSIEESKTFTQNISQI